MRNILKRKIPLPYCKDSKALESCVDCNGNICINSCPQHIIKKDGNSIYLDYGDSGCIFCGICADVCNEVGLKILDKNVGNTINAYISLNEYNCLAWKQVLCSYCLDVCENHSIKFIGNLYPEILETCTKCGLCYSVCPTDAINFNGI